mmetsp:Transcript_28964/g.61485  ORF Transcript_28964/g.61485 Transcript_28964/m.61485 type:complete len:299 (+) Transcript_28964:306-1202(+)
MESSPVQLPRSVVLIVVKRYCIAPIDPNDVSIASSSRIVVRIIAMGIARNALHEQAVLARPETLRQVQRPRLIFRLLTEISRRIFVVGARQGKPGPAHPVHVVNHREYPWFSVVVVDELAPRAVPQHLQIFHAGGGLGQHLPRQEDVRRRRREIADGARVRSSVRGYPRHGTILPRGSVLLRHRPRLLHAEHFGGRLDPRAFGFGQEVSETKYVGGAGDSLYRELQLLRPFLASHDAERVDVLSDLEAPQRFGGSQHARRHQDGVARRRRCRTGTEWRSSRRLAEIFRRQVGDGAAEE